MNSHEDLIWEQLNKSKKNRPTPQWLANTYSPELSNDLRMALAEELGQLSQEGWIIIKTLIDTHGPQVDLIHAAGLCHQAAAREWLMHHLEEGDQFNIHILKALACWGAFLPKELLVQILGEPEEATRLAGLELLKFKAHQLNNSDLLKITKEILTDIRDPVVIAAIRILQRREGVDICNRIAEVAKNGSDSTAKVALMALGSIATSDSEATLIMLCKNLTIESRRDLARKQLEHHHRTSSMSRKDNH